MKKILIILFILTGWFISPSLKAQSTNGSDSSLVQFTGFVVSYDSTKTIPFVNIRIKGTSRATYSDMQGYFSFVARKNDVIVFSCVGYEPKVYTFPTNLAGAKFKTIIALTEDTFMLEEAVIVSYPTPEQLDYMFTRTPLPTDDDYHIAQQNLRRKPVSDMAFNLPNDGAENARWKFNDYANKAYYNGQTQPIPVLDVVAWSKFLQSLQNGDLKRK